MPAYEYKVVPAPEKGLKGKGVKGTRERFANALQALMNELGAQGWEYVRADMLPCEERSGLTGSNMVYQNMLVFRRVTAGEEVSFAPPRTEAKTAATPAPASPAPAPAPVAMPVEAAPSEAVEEPQAEAAESGKSTEEAAAAAAHAALNAYRHQGKTGPKLGPAGER